MIVLLIFITVLSIKDAIALKSKIKMKDWVAYVIAIILAGIFIVFYISNPDRDSISKIVLSLVGKAV